jgi:hypothetical protein
MMPGGRATKLTPELQARICQAIAAGNYYVAGHVHGQLACGHILGGQPSLVADAVPLSVRGAAPDDEDSTVALYCVL